MNTFDIVDYVSVSQVQRNKIFLPQNLVSLVEQGEKVVHYANTKTTITNNQFAVLSSGNCLMTEKLYMRKFMNPAAVFLSERLKKELEQLSGIEFGPFGRVESL